jgi:hypothetical protein
MRLLTKQRADDGGQDRCRTIAVSAGAARKFAFAGSNGALQEAGALAEILEFFGLQKFTGLKLGAWQVIRHNPWWGGIDFDELVPWLEPEGYMN